MLKEEKTMYENADIEIIKFAVEDIITISSGESGNNGIGEDFGENDGEWL